VVGNQPGRLLLHASSLELASKGPTWPAREPARPAGHYCRTQPSQLGRPVAEATPLADQPGWLTLVAPLYCPAGRTASCPLRSARLAAALQSALAGPSGNGCLCATLLYQPGWFETRPGRSPCYPASPTALWPKETGLAFLGTG